LKVNNIDGLMLKEMFISGAYELENNKESINALNVFPVPDGDTGTNMSATIMSAVSEVNKLQKVTIQSVVSAAAMGSLMGARGNSGVILSQLMRGFSKSLKEKETISTRDFSNALKEGVNIAYRAVMKPTEGTILTVARESADRALEVSKTENDFENFIEKVFEQSQISLNRTPNLLPVLKDAGVVDSGGKGLVLIYSGMLKRLKGIPVELNGELKGELKTDNKKPIAYENLDTSNIKYGYCTEFFIKTKNGNPDEFKNKISKYGDSMIVVGTENLIKVHIHTNEPGTVLQQALKIGELSKVKIDNMREQHSHILDEESSNLNVSVDENLNNNIQDNELKDYGLITVAIGDGIKKIFKELGVDIVIEGGQTMNPSTHDILDAINSINAKNIFVLPNNGNIIMAAEQAEKVSGKNVTVIPTKSIPQGITAVVTLNPEAAPEENKNEMIEAIKGVKTGQITYAVRNTTFEDVDIKEGNILGMVDGKLIKTGDNIDEVTKEIIDSMIDESSELVTVFFGNNLKEEDTSDIKEYISSKYGNCDLSINYGGQPLYYYIISVE
jgi:hypothetical protein